MMKQAAISTIKRGYNHFITSDYDRQTGSQIVGMSSNMTGFGYTQINVWRAPTEKTSVLIMMFKAGDEIPSHAWAASEVLAKEGKM